MAQTKQLIQIYPALITYRGKAHVVITQTTQRYDAADCRDYHYHESHLEKESYQVAGRGKKIEYE